MQLVRKAGLITFCEKAQGVRAGFPLLFLLLCAINASSLSAPPFWDDIIGVHTQAVFMARSRFDLAALLASSSEAGSACYNPFSVLSWGYALLYSFLPPVMVHTIGHLLNCACLAGCGGLFLELSRRHMNPTTAFLGVVFAITHPLLASRAAAMGQEALLAFFFMLTLFLWSRRARKSAVWCALASLFVKLTGAVLLFGIAADHCAALCAKRKKRKKLRGLIGTAAAIVLTLGLYLFHFRSARSHFAWKPDEIAGLIKNAYFLLLPELLVALTLFACAVRKGGAAMFRWHRVRIFAWVVIFFYAANFFSAQLALPRYGAVIVFPTVLLLLTALETYRWRATAGVLVLLSVFNLFCCFGVMLPDIPELSRHDGSLLERSLEYTFLRDHYRLFCGEIEKTPPTRPLVTPWPLLQMLTVPEFGYVRAPVPNIVAGEYPHPLGNFRRLDKEILSRGVLVSFEPNCYNWRIPAAAKIIYAASPKRPFSDFMIYALPPGQSASRSETAPAAGRR